MSNIHILGCVGIFIFFGGCATHSTFKKDQIDLYLSTLDDKHFVWCEIDLEQCRKDFETWKRSARGRMIIEEYQQETIGQTYNIHHLPNVFRTRFMDERQLAEEMGEKQAKGYGTSRGS
jgi:hypothetical protein